MGNRVNEACLMSGLSLPWKLLVGRKGGGGGEGSLVAYLTLLARQVFSC